MELSIELPPKSLFKAEEICSYIGVKPYILRFWEAEFEDISPIISATGQKLYERKDIEIVLMIKQLLFEQKHSIERARLELKKLLTARRQKQQEEISLPESHENVEAKALQEKLWMAREKLLAVQNTIQTIRQQWI